MGCINLALWQKEHRLKLTPQSEKYVKYVVRKAIMGRTSYIICKAQCKLQMWSCW